jgi:hypothetical protein
VTSTADRFSTILKILLVTSRGNRDLPLARIASAATPTAFLEPTRLAKGLAQTMRTISRPVNLAALERRRVNAARPS